MDESKHLVSVFFFMVCAMFPAETTYIVTSPGEEAYASCPVGYTLLDGICYRLVTASKTFQAAEAWCNAAPGGHLAAFHSQQEYHNLINLKAESGESNSFTWVGIKREAVFTDGSSYNYTIEDAVMDDVCIRIQSSGVPNGRPCSATYRYICMVKGPCGLAGFTQGGGYCYKASADGDLQDFRTAETECKKNKEGHPAAFHSTEEYDTIDNLAKEDMWIGLLAFKFTDRSTYDFYIAGQDLTNENNNCGGLEGNVPKSVSCGSPNPFICGTPYRKAEYIVNVSLTARSDLNKLFDGDVTSCVVTTSLFTRRDVYTAGLFVTSVNGTSKKDTIALNVTFESDIICHKRKILFSDVDTNSQCRTVKACDLITLEAVQTPSCGYECPCSATGCDVMYIDSLSEYEAIRVDVCELNILGIFDYKVY